MQFLKCVKVALLISGTAFTVASLPAVRLANERVNIQLNQNEVFSGELRNASGAYLSLAGLVSASLGLAGFSFTAWRQTSSHLAQTKLTVADLESLVQQREKQLEAAQLAPAKLQQDGLDQFLDDHAPLPPVPAFPQQIVQRAVAQSAAPQPAAAPLPASPLPTPQPATVVPLTAPQPTTVQSRQPRAMPAMADVPSHISAVNSDRSMELLHQRLAAQTSQLQAVQAQLQQQNQAAARQQHLIQPAPVRQPAGLSTGGFTVINPYQVQAAPQPGRQSQPSRQPQPSLRHNLA